MLTKEQIAHFETFGFVIRRQCFSAGEMEEDQQCVRRCADRDRQGRPFDGEARGRRCWASSRRGRC